MCTAYFQAVHHYPENDNAVHLYADEPAVRGELNGWGLIDVPRYYRKLFPPPLGKLEQMRSLSDTCTVYVANIDTTVATEERIYSIFSRCGEVKRVVLGVNRTTREPCGFCFVVFATHEAAVAAYAFLNGFDVDDRGVANEVRVCVNIYICVHGRASCFGRAHSSLCHWHRCRVVGV